MLTYAAKDNGKNAVSVYKEDELYILSRITFKILFWNLPMLYFVWKMEWKLYNVIDYQKLYLIG